MIILLEPYRVEAYLSEVLERRKASDASGRNISSVMLRHLSSSSAVLRGPRRSPSIDETRRLKRGQRTHLDR
jgi:hypothetical protein